MQLIDVIVCTRNRLNEVVSFLDDLAKIKGASNLDVLLVENSDNQLIKEKIADILKTFSNFHSLKMINSSPGLPRSRNAGLAHTKNKIVVFFDDDVELDRDFFIHLDRIFHDFPDVSGFGSLINRSDRNIKSALGTKVTQYFKDLPLDFFLPLRGLWVQNTKGPCRVTWIPGCAMAFRRDAINGMRFNENLEKGPSGGYALGEDFDFTWRLSRRAKLMQFPDLQIVHKVSPINRASEVTIQEALGRWNAYQDRVFFHYAAVPSTLLFLLFLTLFGSFIPRPNQIGNWSKNRLRLSSYISELLSPTLSDI